MGSLFLSLGAHGEEPVAAFREQATYTLTYLGMRAGTAEIAVGETTSDGRGLCPVVTVAKTSPSLRFFPIQDRFVSFIDPSSSLLVAQHLVADENHRRREQHITVDRVTETATVVVEKPGASPVRKRVAIPPGTQDVASAAFELRGRISQVGQVVALPVLTGAKTFLVEAVVLSRERLPTARGEREVFKVRVRAEASGTHQSKRDMFVYLTTDAARIPVRVEVGLTLGSIVAELTDYRRGRALAAADVEKHRG
jgi:hypothetical protein